jgi:hypothetical protein
VETLGQRGHVSRLQFSKDCWAAVWTGIQAGRSGGVEKGMLETHLEGPWRDPATTGTRKPWDTCQHAASWVLSDMVCGWSQELHSSKFLSKNDV